MLGQVAPALPEDFLTKQFQEMLLVGLIMNARLLVCATCGEVKERVRLLHTKLASREQGE